MEVRLIEGIDLFGVLIFLSWFRIGLFLGGDIARDLFLFFIGMRFSGVTIALASPVIPEFVSPFLLYKTDKSVQILSTTITSGAGAAY